MRVKIKTFNYITLTIHSLQLQINKIISKQENNEVVQTRIRICDVLYV